MQRRMCVTAGNRTKCGGLYLNLDDRSKAANSLSVAYADTLGWSADTFSSRFHDWTFVSLELEDGTPVGAVHIRGDEGHIGIIPKFWGKWGGKNQLIAMCKHFGVKKTCALSDDVRAIKMLEGSGWVKTREIPKVSYYELVG